MEEVLANLAVGYAASKMANISLSDSLTSLENRPLLEKAAHTIKWAFCHHQGNLLKYTIELAEKHKELRIAMDSLAELDIEARGAYTSDISKILKFIDNHNDSYIKKSYDIFEEAALTFFKMSNAKNKSSPRMGLKMAYKENSSEEDFVTNFGEDRNPYRKADNQGIQHVFNKGEPRLVNDIPTEVRNGTFYSSRLSKHRVIEYKKNHFNNAVQRLKMGVDKKWLECWKDYQVDKPPSIYYKSTLIIPITLQNNNVGPLVKEALAIGDLHKDDNITIGALCFDHVDKNYFKGMDINIGFIFADALSLYLFSARNYMEGSGTYLNAQKLLSDHL